MKIPFQLLQLFVLIATSSIAEFPPKFAEDSSSVLPAGHLKKFGYHRPPDGPVAEESGFLHPKIFWQKYVSIHKPMVFRQAVSNSPAIIKWTDAYLASVYGDLDLLLEVKRENRTTSPQRTNVKSFIERYKKDDIYAVTLLPDPMRSEVQVPTCLLCGTFRDFLHETNFWMSSGGTRSVIHYDADENLHCIINGSKDFMMIENKFKMFLPMFQKKQFTGSGFSSLDPDSVDLLEYPDIAKVQWTYAQLFPGDCIYIPSEYLHQVRSYNRTISATMLFTPDTEKSFQDTGCADATFDYTPLSDIDIHWTYQKGDRTIDMGYINLEIIRENLFEIFRKTGREDFTADDFSYFYAMAIEERKNIKISEHAKDLFSRIFEVDADTAINEDHIRKLPRENLKILARSIDDPHGPVLEDDEVEEVEKDDFKEEDNNFDGNISHDKDEL